jgi:hypothetical protein
MWFSMTFNGLPTRGDSTSALFPRSLESSCDSACEPDDIEIRDPSSLAVENDLRGSGKPSYGLDLRISNTRSRYPLGIYSLDLGIPRTTSSYRQNGFTIAPHNRYLEKSIEPVSLSM